MLTVESLRSRATAGLLFCFFYLIYNEFLLMVVHVVVQHICVTKKPSGWCDRLNFRAHSPKYVNPNPQCGCVWRWSL